MGLFGDDTFAALITIFFIATVALLLGLVPIAHHLTFGHKERRDEFLKYIASRDIRDPAYKKFYDRHFGPPAYLLPVVMYCLTLLAAVGVTFWLIHYLRSGSPQFEFVVFALAGAYWWVLYDLLGRLRRRDLSPSVLYEASIRLIMAVPMAYAVTWFASASQSAGPEVSRRLADAVAFALGAFPTHTLVLVIRRLAQRWGLGVENREDKYELEQLQGVTTTTAEKFAELGIYTLLQLAYDDPIRLSARTNLPLRVIVDLMGQALLVLYVSDLPAWQRYLIRSSLDVRSLFDALNDTSDEGKDDRERAKKVMFELAETLKHSQESMYRIIKEIAEDPTTEYLWRLPLTP